MISSENIKQQIAIVFFTQIRVIVITTVVIFILATLVAFFWPPTYASSGKIIVKGRKVEKSAETLEKTESQFFRLTQADLRSEIEIIESKETIKNTVKYLKENNLCTNIKNLSASGIKNNLKSSVLPASNVIKLTMYNKNRDDVATILNALIHQYLISRAKINNPESTSTFFSQQVTKFKENLHEKGEELMTLINKSNITNPEQEIQNNIFHKKDLELQLATEKNKSIELKEYVEHLEEALSKDGIQFFSFIQDNIPISNLSSKLQELVVERGRILRLYRPESEKVRTIDKQIEDLYAKLRAEVEAYKQNQENLLAISNKKIVSMISRIDHIDEINVELQKQIIKSDTIKRDFDLLKESYETFARRKEEAEIARRTGTAGSFVYVSILTEPGIPSQPYFPNKKLLIPLGLFIGFINGSSIAFIKEFLDHTFKTVTDVEKYTELPVIFSCPLWEKKLL